MLRQHAANERKITQLRYMQSTSQQREISSDDDIACSQEAEAFDASHLLPANPFVDAESDESDNSHYGYSSQLTVRLAHLVILEFLSLSIVHLLPAFLIQ